MKSETILKKAITKAVNNGWEDGRGYLARIEALRRRRLGRKLSKILEVAAIEAELFLSSPFGIIFSHDFAKAFWKDEPDRKLLGYNSMARVSKQPTQPAWQYHLQQLVLEKDPIKYLEKFLK